MRAKLLTCNEWEYFASNGEDLSGDHSKEVKRIVGRLLQEWKEEALDKAQEVEEQRYWESETEAEKIVAMRWRQIADGVVRFLQG